jgi:hypothetical protein
MDIMELGAIGELVGGVAVVASLVYVGLQIKQSNNLAGSAVEVENGRMMMDYIAVGAGGDLSWIYYKVLGDPESSTQEEKARFLWGNAMWIQGIQTMFRQYQRGLLPEASWRPLVVALANVLDKSPYLEQEVWIANSAFLADDFREYINRKRPEVAKDPFWSPPTSLLPKGA